MKKITVYLLLAAMLLSLWGCSLDQKEPTEANLEASADLDDARKLYDSLSEEDQLSFYEEITAKQKERQAEELAEIMPKLYGEWRIENPLYQEYDSVYAKEILINEDMTYEYGRQKGTWYIDEEDGLIWFVNGEDGVCCFSFMFGEEDGFVQLLCCEEAYSYVRKEDFRDILDKKYVIMLRTMAPEFFGEPKYVGTMAENVGYGANAPLCILESLAYDNGLIYVGATSPFIMEVDLKLKNGSTVTHRVFSPFDYMEYHEGAEVTDIRIESGIAYFIRSEYVEDVFIDENGWRTVLLKNGAVYCGGSSIWEFFPELPFEDFRF